MVLKVYFDTVKLSKSSFGIGPEVLNTIDVITKAV